MPDDPKHAAEKRPPRPARNHDQADHEGAAHDPSEFDSMNPAKQVDDGKKRPDR